MSAGRNERSLCVLGLAYFEVYLPASLEVQAGRERFVPEIPLRVGGALNSASVAAMLGERVCLAHPAGEGISDLAVRALEQRLGLSALHWPAIDDCAISLVSRGGGERAFISAADFAAFGSCPELSPHGWVHVCGLAEAEAAAMRLAQERAAGAKISVAGSWVPQLLDALRLKSEAPWATPEWDLLVLNAAEAVRVAGKAEDAPARLAAVAQDVIVTDGSRGAFGWVGGQPLRVEAVRTVRVDDTGAGDAFCAGLLVAMMRGFGARHALEYASRVAARQLTLVGGLATDRRVYADLAEEQ